MAKECCNTTCLPDKTLSDRHFRRVLWIALAINALMFVVELAGGLWANSVAVLADSVDFLGDSANYAVTLLVLPLGLFWRSRAALLKGLTMGTYAVFVLGLTVYNTITGNVPEAITMGAVGFVALVANVSVALMLYSFRSGDSNMRSVWLCSRNDAITNIAVMLAALGVFGTGSGWPDLVVAALIGGLGLVSGVSVVRHARHELLNNSTLTRK